MQKQKEISTKILPSAPLIVFDFEGTLTGFNADKSVKHTHNALTNQFLNTHSGEVSAAATAAYNQYAANPGAGQSQVQPFDAWLGENWNSITNTDPF